MIKFCIFFLLKIFHLMHETWDDIQWMTERIFLDVKNKKINVSKPMKCPSAIHFHFQRRCLLDDDDDVLDDRSLSRSLPLSSSPRLRLFIGLRGSLTSFEYQSSFFVDASLARTSPCSSKHSVCVSHLSLFSSSSSSSTTVFGGTSDVDASDAVLLITSNFDLNFFSNCKVNCSLQRFSEY